MTDEEIVIKHWASLLVAMPLLFLSFGIETVGDWLLRLAKRVGDLAERTERVSS
jgi:hypothetical protein